MLNEAQIKSVALFFFFTCMDEAAAFQSSTKTIDKCRKRFAKGSPSEEDVASIIVNYTHQAWRRWAVSSDRSNASLSHNAGWVLSPGVDFGVWQDFRKSSDAEEFLAVIWSKLLKFSDEQIAKGLGVTVGTVRHRVGRGLRQLGRIRKGPGK